MVAEFDSLPGQGHLWGQGLRSLLFLVWMDGCQGSPTWCSGVTGRARPLLVLMLVGVVRIPIT